jgi:hypothetical protein
MDNPEKLAMNVYFGCHGFENADICQNKTKNALWYISNVSCDELSLKKKFFGQR